MWKNVLDGLPRRRRVDEDDFRFFREPLFQVDGRARSLDDLEKRLIRPRFPDGRIHFALNCASGGCPRLPREAFVPERLQAQLDREARRFCTERRNVDYDAGTGALRLSMIFKWYRDDFAKDDAGLVAFLNRHRPKDAQIVAGAQGIKITHVPYDWRLNDPSLPAR